MSVCLTKGGNTSLTKEAPNLTIVAVAVGWDVRVTPSADFDLDASAIACGDDRTILSDKHFVFFHNRSSPDGPIQHTGDNLDGSGDGDGYGDGDGDTINADLASTPPNITKIFFPVSIYDGDKHNQTFGQVDNAYIRVGDTASGAEPARYDLFRTRVDRDRDDLRRAQPPQWRVEVPRRRPRLRLRPGAHRARLRRRRRRRRRPSLHCSPRRDSTQRNGSRQRKGAKPIGLKFGLSGESPSADTAK